MDIQNISQQWLDDAKSRINYVLLQSGAKVKSSHVYEALACALNYRTYAALRADLKLRGANLEIIPDIKLFELKLNSLTASASILEVGQASSIFGDFLQAQPIVGFEISISVDLKQRIQKLFEAMHRDQVQRFQMDHHLEAVGSSLPFGAFGLRRGIMSSDYLKSLKGPGFWEPYYGGPDADDLAIEYEKRGFGPTQILVESSKLLPREFDQTGAEFCIEDGFWIGIAVGGSVQKKTLFRMAN